MKKDMMSKPPSIATCPFCNAKPIWQELPWINRFEIEHKEDCYITLGSLDKTTFIYDREVTADCPISGKDEIGAWNKRKVIMKTEIRHLWKDSTVTPIGNDIEALEIDGIKWVREDKE